MRQLYHCAPNELKSINGEMCVVKTEKGDEIKSLKVNVNSVGDASTVSLRPERVEINSSDSKIGRASCRERV